MGRWLCRFAVNGRFMKAVKLRRPHLSDLGRLGLRTAAALFQRDCFSLRNAGLIKDIGLIKMLNTRVVI